MCEAAWPFFRNFNWACSCVQVPRKEEGHEGVKLGYLLNDHGRFHNGHRAIEDCHAVLHLLAQPMRRSKRLAMSALLENARKIQYLLWAENAPFDFKDVFEKPRLPLECRSTLLVDYPGRRRPARRARVFAP